MKFLPPFRVLSSCSFRGSNAFNPKSLVLSALLSVCAHIKLKLPFSGLLYWLGLCLASLACGRAGSSTQALPVAQKPGGSALMWHLHSDGGSSSAIKVGAGSLVAWRAEQAVCTPSDCIHLAFNCPQMPAPALSWCVGLQNAADAPLTLWPFGSFLTMAGLGTSYTTVMEPSTLSTASVWTSVFCIQKPTKQQPLLRYNSFISDVSGVMQ